MNNQDFDSNQPSCTIDSFSDLRTEKNANFDPLDDKVNFFESNSTYRIPGKLNSMRQTCKYVGVVVLLFFCLVSIAALVLANLAITQQQNNAATSALSSQGYQIELNLTKDSLETVSENLLILKMKLLLSQNETSKWKNEMLAWKRKFETMPTAKYSSNLSISNSLQSLQRQISILQSNNTELTKAIQRFQINPWPYNGYVYRLTSPQTWQNARTTCQSLGGDLAVVGIKDYMTRITVADALRFNRAWVGLRDFRSDGMWKWIDSSTARSEDIRWGTGEPNNYQGRIEDCADMMGPRWSMNDEYCNHTLAGICEIKFESFEAN